MTKRFFITLCGKSYNLNAGNITNRQMKKILLLKTQITATKKLSAQLHRRLYYIIYEIQQRSDPVYVQNRRRQSNEWYRKNKKHAKEMAKKWQQNHPEKVSAYHKATYQKKKLQLSRIQTIALFPSSKKDT